MKNSDDGRRPSASFIVGAVALLFLIIGYQASLFIHKAAVTRIVANHDRPDTVFVSAPGAVVSAGSAAGTAAAGAGSSSVVAESAAGTAAGSGLDIAEEEYSSAGGDVALRGRVRRRDSGHSPAAESIRRANTPRRYECFPFDPNTASIDDLMRLGFTQKQAQSIDNYRKKGGRFRRKSDFAKSYVVEDSVYRRLEACIDIPKIDINAADSAAFETLPGIGKFFAGRMVSYRKELGGYSYLEQLMDIWHFDQEKFDGLKDLITLGRPIPYSLWTLSEAQLARHPYIGKRAAHSIVLFRDNSPRADWTVGNLRKAGILDPDKGPKLAKCFIADPPQE